MTPLRLRPIFVDLLPDLDAIKDGEIWISHKHRTVNLRCPCGCGHLTILSLHPSRWHVHFDGKTVSLDGPTGGSVWTNSGCGSHYFIRNNTVIGQGRLIRTAMTNTRTSSGNGCSYPNRAMCRLAHGSAVCSAFLRSGNGEIPTARREAADPISSLPR